MKRSQPGRYQVPEGFRDRRADALADLAKAERRAVLAKYARLTRSGSPVFCTPSLAEREGLVPRKQAPAADGKPIFDSKDSADAAAVELQRLGASPMRAYQCKRGTRGHWHLSAAPYRCPK